MGKRREGHVGGYIDLDIFAALRDEAGRTGQSQTEIIEDALRGRYGKRGREPDWQAGAFSALRDLAEVDPGSFRAVLRLAVLATRKRNSRAVQALALGLEALAPDRKDGSRAGGGEQSRRGGKPRKARAG